MTTTAMTERQDDPLQFFDSPSDRALLRHGLEALLRERSLAYRISHAIAEAKGACDLSVHDFDLPDIIRLSRLLDGRFVSRESK